MLREGMAPDYTQIGKTLTLRLIRDLTGHVDDKVKLYFRRVVRDEAEMNIRNWG